MKCIKCGRDEELRLGFCFDCVSAGEERAAKRSVLGHLLKMCWNLRRRKWWQASCDLTWAWQRLTRTGDYATDGTFDWEGYDWR